MRIGIDISQIVHEGTGVARYVKGLVEALLKEDTTNEYVLFGSSLRKRYVFVDFFNSLSNQNNRVKLVTYLIPPTLLEFIWNRLHIIPVEWLIGDVDIFWSSDWVQPPLLHAKGVTTVHDLVALKFPVETDATIVSVHKRRLDWIKKECQMILCDSEATKRDASMLLGVTTDQLRVIYPGGKKLVL